MENENENINSNNDDKNQDIQGDNQDTVPKEDLTKLEETNRQLFERTKKAETETKELKSKLKGLTEAPEKETKPAESQSKTIDEERLARIELKTEGITHPDDQKFIIDESKRLDKDVGELLSEDFFKSKLEGMKNDRTAQDAMPSGEGRTAGLTQKDTDWWLAHPEKHPDTQEMAEKVLDAKIQKSKESNTFSDTMYD